MLHIIGDIDLTEGYFDKGLGIGNSLADKKEDPFEYLSRRDDDLWIGNFECVCSDVQATGSPFIIKLIPVIWNTSAISIVTASRTTMSCSLEMKLTGKWRLTFVGKE